MKFELDDYNRNITESQLIEDFINNILNTHHYGTQ